MTETAETLQKRNDKEEANTEEEEVAKQVDDTRKGDLKEDPAEKDDKKNMPRLSRF